MPDSERATSPADYGVTDALDIGHGMWISFSVDMDGHECGLLEWHDCTHDFCAGGITFDNDAGHRVHPQGPFWTLESREPLTLSPSILCRTCHRHGYIRESRWVPA